MIFQTHVINFLLLFLCCLTVKTFGLSVKSVLRFQPQKFIEIVEKTLPMFCFFSFTSSPSSTIEFNFAEKIETRHFRKERKDFDIFVQHETVQRKSEPSNFSDKRKLKMNKPSSLYN